MQLSGRVPCGRRRGVGGDVESLRVITQLWLDVVRDLLG